MLNEICCCAVGRVSRFVASPNFVVEETSQDMRGNGKNATVVVSQAVDESCVE